MLSINNYFKQVVPLLEVVKFAVPASFVIGLMYGMQGTRKENSARPIAVGTVEPIHENAANKVNKPSGIINAMVRTKDFIANSIYQGIDRITNTITYGSASIHRAAEGLGKIYRPDPIDETTKNEIDLYIEHERSGLESLNDLPEIVENPDFQVSDCKNPYNNEEFFKTWASHEKGRNLQRIDQLLLHPAMHPSMDQVKDFITYTFKKCLNNPQALIHILEAMVVALARQANHLPQIVEIPVNRTGKHSGKVLFNGILTYREEVLVRAVDEYLTHGGEQITMVCVPSRGIVADSIDVWKAKNGCCTLATYVGHQALDRLLTYYPNQGFLVQMFSGGSAVFDAITPYIAERDLKRLVVHTFGGTKFARNDKGYLDAKNFASKQDPVPMTELANIHLQGVSDTLSVTVVYVESKGFIEHHWDRTYGQARQDSYKIFLDKTQNLTC